jgi:hypothetical protein
MASRWLLGWVRVGAVGIFATPGVVWAQSSYSIGTGGGMPVAKIPALAGLVPRRHFRPYWMTIGPDGLPIIITPPLLVISPAPIVLPPPAIGPAMLPPSAPDRGVRVPWPPPRPLSDSLPKPKPGDPTRAQQLTAFGDRLFRVGNLHRAAERYEQAIRADAHVAAPHVGLAQIAIARGQFTEAAKRFRQSLDAQPDWLINPPDVQALYGEPVDFNRTIAQIEMHLQANPNDRDAWLVLGAQWYLSGRARKAADVFLRLADRPVDPTLSAFLDAATPAVK